MTSREKWFKQRIINLIYELTQLENIKDWEKYKIKSHELAEELLYATTEWDKYYKKVNDESNS